MSRPPVAASQSSSADDGSSRLTQPSRAASQPQPAMHPLQRDNPHNSASGSGLSLPPLRQMSSTPPTPSSDRKSLGVYSILNPQADLLEQQRNRRRSGSQLQTPSPVESQPPQLPSISRPTSVDSTQGESAMGRPLYPPERPPMRNLMSPRSPALHRAQSLGGLKPPTATIDAQQSPFLSTSGRPIGSDPITSQPALPTPPIGGRTTYVSHVPPTAPTPPPSMVRNELRQPSVSFPQSGSASPSANYSPYSQPASVASSQFEGTSQQSAYVPAPHNPQMQDPRQMSLPMETERNSNRIPMGSAGQSSIQIMTIQDKRGHPVQIPVDVQAASKVADEKRKRNAGASARFRARRKEKEREASMSITRLETQLREAFEDAEYYRGERDYFKSIVFQQPGAERHYARPPSPRLRRLSTPPSNAPSTTGGGSADSPYSAYDEDVQEPGRNVRRRTSNYHPPSGSMPTQSNGTGQPPSTYPPAFHPVNAPPPHASMNANRPQHQSFDPRDQRQLPDAQRPAQQAPVFRDSFAPNDSSRYESRGWAPGPGQGRDHRG